MACDHMMHENIWHDKWRFDDAERLHFERQSRPDIEEPSSSSFQFQSISCDSDLCEQLNDKGERAGLGSLATQIAKARQEIQDSLSQDKVIKPSTSVTSSTQSPSISCQPDVLNRVVNLEKENAILKNAVKCLEENLEVIKKRMDELASGGKPVIPLIPKPAQTSAAAADEDDDDDVDLFGSDDEEEDEEAARVKEERLKAYADKKSKKPGPIAKSSILLDCKPWDDETDMKEMEKVIRTIEMDGLVWGAAKLQPLAFGIMKLSILCTIEDEKVSVDDLSEKITEFEDLVQSVDIAAFNKV